MQSPPPLAPSMRSRRSSTPPNARASMRRRTAPTTPSTVRTVDEVLNDLRAQRVRAVVVSVACCGPAECSHLARLVREFPRVPAIALLTRLDPATPQAMLTLGQCGIRDLVDAREGAGWHQLRDALASSHGDDLVRLALGHALPRPRRRARRLLALLRDALPPTGSSAARCGSWRSISMSCRAR